MADVAREAVPVRMRRDALENQERVLAAAAASMVREGRHVPMGAIAEAAGVGVATLYRRFPTREALLSALTERSFSLVLQVAQRAAAGVVPAIVRIERFYEATIAHRDQLVLPLHGGPSALSPVARSLQREVRDTISGILDEGRRDRSVRPDAAPMDVIGFGALLAQPITGAGWDAVLRRQMTIHLSGLAARSSSRELP